MSTGNQFEPELIRRYDGPGPRYTSYPTALQLRPDFGTDDYRELCAVSNARRAGQPLSVYIHVPFCHSLCYYCACSKIVTRHPEKAARYLQRLHGEIDLQAGLFEQGRLIGQLHLGGGTPTFLDEEQLGGLLEHLDRAFGFAPSGEREFSIEIDPRTLAPGALRVLRDQGFNRVSFGVQDLDPRVQAAVNRIQPEEMTLSAVEEARAADFAGLSMDLIYGLPLQTVDSFAATLERVIAARPDRLAIYNYAHLPQVFRAQRLIDAEQLPGPAEKLEIFSDTVHRLTGAGYEHIGLDHFALPEDGLAAARRDGTLQRNFQGYSTYADCDLLGLGLTAIGKVGDGYAQNHKMLNDYFAAVDAGSLPVTRGMRLNTDDRIRAAVIQRLMCHDYLDFKDLEALFDIRFFDYFRPEIEALSDLEADGLVAVSDEGIAVTRMGRFLLRPIAMVFDAYLPRQRDGNRFSRVI